MVLSKVYGMLVLSLIALPGFSQTISFKVDPALEYRANAGVAAMVGATSPSRERIILMVSNLILVIRRDGQSFDCKKAVVNFDFNTHKWTAIKIQAVADVNNQLLSRCFDAYRCSDSVHYDKLINHINYDSEHLYFFINTVSLGSCKFITPLSIDTRDSKFKNRKQFFDKREIKYLLSLLFRE